MLEWKGALLDRKGDSGALWKTTLILKATHELNLDFKSTLTLVNPQTLISKTVLAQFGNNLDFKAT